MPSACRVITFRINFAIMCHETLEHKAFKYYPNKTMAPDAFSARRFLILQKTPEIKNQANTRLSFDKIKNPGTYKFKD